MWSTFGAVWRDRPEGAVGTRDWGANSGRKRPLPYSHHRRRLAATATDAATVWAAAAAAAFSDDDA